MSHRGQKGRKCLFLRKCGLLTLQHGPVCPVGDGEEVRGHLVPPLAQVELNHCGGVDGKPLVGVDHHAEEAGVGVDELADISALEIPQDRRLIQEGEVGHVLTLLKLGWIDLSYLITLEGLFLKNKTSKT